MLFEFSAVSIILFLLLMAGFITLWAASLLSSKRANKPIRLADDDTKCVKLVSPRLEGRREVSPDSADGKMILDHLARKKAQAFRSGTYVPPTYMSRHARRAALKMNRSA